MTQDMNHTIVKAFRAVFVATMMLTSGNAMADGVVVKGNVYGGGNLATVGRAVTVNISAGEVQGDVYGGGALANTNITEPNEIYAVTIKKGESVVGYYTDAACSEAATGTAPSDETYYRKNVSTVSLIGGIVMGDVYGGGLGRKEVKSGETVTTEGIAALVYGDVTVNLNNNSGTCQINGSVFGCNNLNGTPKSDVRVNVYGTHVYDTDGTSTKAKPTKFENFETPIAYTNVSDEQLAGHTFELKGVFGGGNEAAYSPNDGKTTAVNIYGCGTNSIKEVYGGGNAADVPAATVNVNGAYEIGYVYAGGKGTNSVAANVNGNATTTIYGGTVYRTFAGSNTNGDITGTSTLTISERASSHTDYCVLKMGDVFSYGNLATMSGTSQVNIGCTTNKIGALYGGAMNANIGSSSSARDIVLNINGGKFHQVFGGNKSGGTIYGSVTVNVEQTECDIEIDNLYGCGNLAPYTTPEGKDGPQINIISCKQIDNIFGGGLGSAAVVTGNPEININMVYGLGQTSALGTIGNVYGGGSEADVTGNTAVNIGTAENVLLPSTVTSTSTGTSVAVVGANITGDVFGGGYGHDTNVTGTAYINIGGATKDTDGNVTDTEDYHATFTGNVSDKGIYGGSALGTVANTQVNLYAGTIPYNVYGGGKGQLAQAAVGTEGQEGYKPAVEAQAATVGTAHVSLYNTTVTGSIYGGCNDNGETTTTVVNLIGGTVGTDPGESGSSTTVNKVFGGGQGHLTTTTNATVNVGTSASVGTTNVYSNVYGGSALGAVGTSNVYLNKATILTGNVFGGGMGTGTDDATAATITMAANVWLNNLDIQTKNIYGGCNVNGWAAATTVYLLDGKVYDVYGGGFGPNTYVKGDVNVYVGKSGESGDGTTVYHDVYGGSAQGHVNAEKGTSGPTTTYHDGAAIPETSPVQYEQVRYTTNVDLFKGEIKGDVYGGGLGDADHAAYVGGDVTVSVNNNNGTCKVDGGIFGCNNANGSPKGHVIVHVYQTAARTGQDYDLAAVYGGGNEADYVPDDDAQSTEVVIEGCGKTSIQNVYGGGNAAAVPATDVWILGTEKIETVFGGGNGVVAAANVGFDSNGVAYTNTNVSGKARTQLVAGKNITTVYGGSNTNGDIRGGTWISMPQASEYPGYVENVTSCCDLLQAAHVYGGGKNASMRGGTNIILGCMEENRIDEIYAGSEHADVEGGVSLTITSGIFGRVFGGNKDGGRLMGSIKVNIEETGNCDKPIVIGELYGGGNLAGYSIYGYKNTGTVASPVWEPMTEAELRAKIRTENSGKTDAQLEQIFQDTKYDDPQLNIRAFTSIGTVFGGGFQAMMIANPTVGINVAKGSHAATAYSVGNVLKNIPIKKKNASGTLIDTTISPSCPDHPANSIGVIGNVFGGGNEAIVDGSVTVNIGTERTITFNTKPNGTMGTTGQTLDTEGVDYIQTANGLYEAKAEGAIITGNIYGGGNLANVTGNTQVNICAEEVTSGTTTTWQSVTPGTAGVTIAGNVYGGGKGVARESGDRAFFCEEAMVGIDGTNSATNNNSSTYANYGTHVRIGNGTIGNGTTGGNVYGGGEIGRVEFHTEVVIGLGEGTGAATKSPVINGSVFGAGKGTNTHGYSGLVRGDSRVTIQGDAKVGHSVYGGGEMASVGKYEVVNGLPKTPLFGGKCTVTIGGYAEI